MHRVSFQGNTGYAAAILAFTVWGLLIIYWRSLGAVDPLLLLALRIISSFVLTWFIILVRNLRKDSSITAPNNTADSASTSERNIFAGLRPRSIGLSLVAAVVLSSNWYFFIWAVASGYSLDTSLGYFLAPLVNVALGMIFLRERPGLLRILAIALSSLGIVILTVERGELPLVSLALALSFGFYAFTKKHTRLNSTLGFGMEMLWLLIPAVIIVIVHPQNSILIDVPLWSQILIALSGPFTVLPLTLFAYAAQRIPLYILGFFQYITPSLIFLIVLFVFNQRTTALELTSFILVWIALAIFSSSLGAKKAAQ